MTLFAFRPALPRDTRFIVDSWVDSYRTAYAAGVAPMGEFLCHEPTDHGVILVDRGYRANAVAWVRGIIERPGCAVLVAYRPGLDPGDEIAGWLCHESGLQVPKKHRELGRWVEKIVPAGPVVHYVYVKDIYRQHRKLGSQDGVATQLFAAAGIPLRSKFLFTHKTPIAAQLARTHAPLAEWNPLLCRFPKNNPEAQEEK